MSRPQRLGLAVLAVVVLVIAFIALRPAAKDDGATATTPTAAATTEAAAAPPATTTVPPDATVTTPPTQTLVPDEATPAPTPTATTPAVPVLRAGTVRKLEVDKGDTVRFAVRSATAEEVHIHGYDIKKDLEAGKTAQVSFKATIEGIFEIEFEGAGEQIAELRVDP